MALTLDAVRSLILRQMAPTIRRVNLMVSRGVIRRVTDSARAQLVQVSLLGDSTTGDEEIADDVEHVQPFGVSFVPPAGSEVAAICVGGNRDHVLVLGASSRAHRPTGASEGEGGLYTLNGWKVFLDDEGNVYLGGDAAGATFQVALASKVEAELDKIRSAIADAATTAEDGGAAFKAAIVGAWGTREAVGSSKVKAVE
jgi:phage baseplate assembly protein V